MSILEVLIFMCNKYILGIFVLLISIFAYYFFKKLRE